VVQDKVDMSLDDIIRLNRREQQSKGRQTAGNRRPAMKKGRFAQGKGFTPRTGGPVQKGGVVARLGLRARRGPPPVGRRRAQGVITGLAARRTAALQKGISPLNKVAVYQKPGPRTRPFIQRNNAPYRKAEVQQRRPYRQMEVQRRPYRQTELQRSQSTTPVRRPFQLRRRPLPPVHQAQREARQATFLFHRGLKVHTQVQKPSPPDAPIRTRPWQARASTATRTSTDSSGILTVSIDNPTARTQPEPATSWVLHPPAAPPAPVVKAEETEVKKIPKGVPLQFDINSVGKPQTAMTLNERFRILKDRRVATAHSSKGSRFVTVG